MLIMGYMQYDNISYIIYGEYSKSANSNRGMVYDLKNEKSYYTYLVLCTVSGCGTDKKII